MLKTYIAGVLLGVAASIAVLRYVPVVDLDREMSIIAVTPNGGNSEIFRVNLPDDRIMSGAASVASRLPQGMYWPDDANVGNVRAELFKLRNARGAVIGVASRMPVGDDRVGRGVEWALHFPARGTMFVSLNANGENGMRSGSIHGGTREFATLSGAISERWIAGSNADSQPASGAIELAASYKSEVAAEAPGDEG